MTSERRICSAVLMTTLLLVSVAQGGALILNPFPGTEDADTGIGSDITYTHAYNFRSAANPTINGVTFSGVGNAHSGADWALGNVDAQFDNNTQNRADVNSDLHTLLNNFYYRAEGALTVSGLEPDLPYRLRIYASGWGSHAQIFSADDTSPPTTVSGVPRNAGDNDVPASLDYVYTLGAGDTDLAVTISPDNEQDGTWHWYGFSNEIVPEPASFLLLLIGLLTVTRYGRSA